MIVLDTSALLDALVPQKPRSSLIDAIARADSLHAPCHLDIEFLHALRGLTLGRKTTQGRVAAARSDFAAFLIARYPIHIFADRVWEFRRNVTACDAAYLALAEVLECPLLSTDQRLISAAGQHTALDVIHVAE